MSLFTSQNIKLISCEIQLVSRPQGLPTAANFALVETKLELLKDEWILIRNLYLSVDPYMQGRMNDHQSYVPPFELCKAMDGGAFLLNGNYLRIKNQSHSRIRIRLDA